MRINPSSSQPQPVDALNRAREAARPTPTTNTAVGATPAATRVDRVEISDAGRALAARGPEADAASGEMSADRLAVLRQRVLSGAYDSLHVVEQVAQRMLQRGDV